MRQKTVRLGAASRRSDGRLGDRHLDPQLYSQAWRRFLDEDYESSLELARRCLDQIAAGDEPPLSLVGETRAPTVQDGVVLAARSLYQLDRHAEFEVLLASAGRWGMVPEKLAELDVVQLAFACKRGDYIRVVEQATAYIDSSCHELPPVIADFLYLRSLAHSHLGDPEPAREDAEAGYAVFRLLGSEFECARTANLLGVIAFRSGSYAEAETWWRRAHELHARLGMIKNMGGNRLNLGIVAYKRGQFDRAVIELEAASRLLEQVDAQVSLCRAAIALGNVRRLQSRREEARRVLLEAYEKANALMLSREEALALEFLGDVFRDEGRIDRARRYYSRALAIGSSIAPEGDIVMEVLRRQGECLLLLGRQSEAVKILGQALTLARRLGDRFEEGVIRRVLAQSLLSLTDLEAAKAAAGEAVRLLREVEGAFELAHALLVAVNIAQARLDAGLAAEPRDLLESAWRDAMSALDLFLTMDVEEWILKTRQVLNAISEAKHDYLQADRAPAGRDSISTTGPVPIIHVSSRMRDLIQLADAFADSDEPVLITGQTGTGKELFARRLHRRSRRRGKDLVCVNVAAIPASLFAREMFGHVKGSFSSADSDGCGLAARADGGTLFLDEIGDLPLELQPQLLRLLQDGTYQAIGDPTERRVDIRLLAATNADLKQRVTDGRFRADLYYRLKILELRLPAVNDRREDILPLLRHFLAEAAGHQVELADYFNAASLECAQNYSWPGNVREIAMAARRASLQLAASGRVQVEVDGTDGEPFTLTGPAPAERRRTVLAPRPNGDGGLDRSRILLALAESRGNRARAARRLGISRSTLYRQMDRLGVGPKVAVPR